MAFDHDLLSFVDVKFGTWPVILITNPKRDRFLLLRHEPLMKMVPTLVRNDGIIDPQSMGDH